MEETSERPSFWRAIQASVGERVAIADIYLPRAARRNPCGAYVELLARANAERAGLFVDHDVRRFDAGGSLAPYVFPTASASRLLACCQWINTLFYLDDQFDENAEFVHDLGRVRATMEAYLDLLRDGTPMAEFPAFSRLALDLRGRLLHLGSERWFASLRRSTEQYLLEGALPAARAWGSHQRLDLDAYLSSRDFDSGAYTGIDMIEIAAAIDLPDHVRSSDEIVALRRLCARHLALVNDVMSYDKEVPQHDNPSNILCIFMEEYGLSFRDAAAETIGLINMDMRCFLDLEANLSDQGPAVMPMVRAYVEGMHSWMRGNVDWSLSTRRYATRDNPFQELRLAAGDS
jgi:hypothetical protein